MSTPQRQNLTFPVGRLVTGSVYEPRDKDQKGNPLTTKDGKPRVEFSFGVAIEKKPGELAFYQTDWGLLLYNVARTSFPNMFDPTTGQLRPGYKFSYKVTDGDSTEYNTAVPPKRPCDTPEWKNCWIVWFKSAFAPKTYDIRQWNPKMGGNPPELPAAEIQCGDYIQVAGSIDSNGDTQKAGVYVNHNMVALAGYHPAGRISRGPDVASANFGASPLPAGMVSAPVGGLPPVAGQPAAQVPPPAAAPLPPLVGGAPIAPPQTAVTPHAAILAPPAAAVAPPPPAAAPALPVGPQVTAKANGATWAQLQAAGWTEAVARANGVIV